MKAIKILFLCFLSFVILSSCGNNAVQPSGPKPDNSTVASDESLSQSTEKEQNEPAMKLEQSVGDGYPALIEYITLDESDWREAYAAYLEENKNDILDFHVADMNEDGIPEVVFRYNDETNDGAVLSFIDNKLQILKLFVVSGWGKAGYLEKDNQFICLQWYGHTSGTFGSVDFYLYAWTPDGYTEKRSVNRKSGYDNNNGGNGVYGQGYINGEKVDFDEFEIALAEMYELLEASTWFVMTDAGQVDDYLNYFLQWEQESTHP